MTPAPLSPRRLALALAAGTVAVAVLAAFFPPGRYDNPPTRLSATPPADEAYWSAPIRDRMGAGRLEPYDQGLALSLALPQNVVGVAAQVAGASVDVARVSGSLVAVFALAVLAVLWGGWRGLALGALLLNPFVWGQLATDLAEGPALALVAGWLYATGRGRVATAAALAAFGVFQKGCGLFLGVGSLAAALAGPDRGPRLLRAAAGVAFGLLLSCVAARFLFGADPVRFLLRPWSTTQDVRPVAQAAQGGAWASRLIQVAFAGYHGAGPRLALVLSAALVAAPRARPPGPVLAALAASLVYYGLFPDKQRLLPLVPLLVLPAFPARGEEPTARPQARGWASAGVLALEASSAVVAAIGVDAGALRLGLVALATGLAARLALPRLAARTSLVVAGLLLGAAAVAGPLAGGAEPRLRSTTLHELADAVSARVPADADLIGSPVLGLRHAGTLWYFEFQGQWAGQLDAARPARLFRVRGVTTDDPSPPPRDPPGYVRAAEPVRLGLFPYPYDSPRVVFLEAFRRGP